jgi:large subunit ribosomal protein L15
MKLHDLQPAPGSRKPRTRVGRGIAAGKGKTAGRGTKGQKARAGGGIPAWFEGGQTPLHMRIPKLRGFKNRFKIEYEVVNIGAIGALADRGAFEFEDTKKSAKSGPITVNQDILRAVGLVRTLNKPLKILGAGELSVSLFVVADAFTASARSKIEAAGGSVNVLEVPTSPLAALGVTPETADAKATERPAPAKGKAKVEEKAAPEADEPEATAAAPAETAKTESTDDDAEPTKRGKATAAKTAAAKPPAEKAAKTSAKAAKASADADEPADDTATPDEPETADDTASDDATAPANDTELPSGDDA